MENTNLSKIKEVCKLMFDAVKIEQHAKYGFFVQHPFTHNAWVYVPEGEKYLHKYEHSLHAALKLCENSKAASKEHIEHLEQALNLLKNNMVDVTFPEGKEVFRNFMFKQIDAVKKLEHLLLLIDKAWYMTFLKFAEVYLSDKDLGSILSDCWVMQEYPSRDSNASLKEIIKWFKRADKKSLMDEEEYAKYESLRDNPIDYEIELKVYRGVNYDGKPNGLSWTTDLDKAKWFSNRFGTKNAKVYEMTITDPAHILAYFNRRNEEEIVVDTSKCKNWKVIEQC